MGILTATAQEPVACGAGGYASYMPWRFSRTARHGGDQSRLMQTRPLFLSPEMEEREKNGAPLGMAIETERTVPKQGRPCAIRARAWLGGDRFDAADARWTSADGDFAPLSDGADGWTTAFTPSTDGHATVTATVGFLSVSRRLPIEESEEPLSSENELEF